MEHHGHIEGDDTDDYPTAENESSVYRSMGFQPSLEAAVAGGVDREMYDSEDGGSSFGALHGFQCNAIQATFEPDEPPVYRSLQVASAFSDPLSMHGMPGSMMGKPAFAKPSLAQPSLAQPSLAQPSLTQSSLAQPSFGRSLVQQQCKPAFQVTDGSSDFSAVSPRPLPADFPLERTHFYVHGSPDAVARNISAELSRAKADFEFKFDKCKWKGILHDVGSSVEFRVKMFQTEQQRFLVEFQRRSSAGHSLVLNLHNLIHNKLCSDGLVCDALGTVVRTAIPRRAMGPRPMQVRPLPDVPVLNSGSESPMIPLLQMINSPKEDVQFSAITAVVNMAKSNFRDCIIENPEAVARLIDLVKSGSSESVRHLAVLTLLKLSESTEGATRIGKAGAMAALQSAGAVAPAFNAAHPFGMEIQRNSSLAVKNLIKVG